MLFFRKKSFITDWWIAEREDSLKFVDITDKRNITNTCIIHGHTYGDIPKYASSVHAVCKVTRTGVYTSSGRFYPFKSAHPLFLMFLCEIHIPYDSLIASNWECIDTKNNIYTADIENALGEKQENVVFDFEMLPGSENSFVGTSNLLDDVVVLNPFDVRESSKKRITDGPYLIEIYHSAEIFLSMRKTTIRNLKKFLKKQKKNKKNMGS